MKQRIGNLWPGKGLVEHENYEAAMVEFREVKGELMGKLAKNNEGQAGRPDSDSGLFVADDFRAQCFTLISVFLAARQCHTGRESHYFAL